MHSVWLLGPSLKMSRLICGMLAVQLGKGLPIMRLPISRLDRQWNAQRALVRKEPRNCMATYFTIWGKLKSVSVSSPWNGRGWIPVFSLLDFWQNKKTGCGENFALWFLKRESKRWLIVKKHNLESEWVLSYLQRKVVKPALKCRAFWWAACTAARYLYQSSIKWDMKLLGGNS